MNETKIMKYSGIAFRKPSKTSFVEHRDTHIRANSPVAEFTFWIDADGRKRRDAIRDRLSK